MPVARKRQDQFPLTASEHEPADHRHFVLSEEQWLVLTAAFNRPARRLPALEKLLREPSILDRP